MTKKPAKAPKSGGPWADDISAPKPAAMLMIPSGMLITSCAPNITRPKTMLVSSSHSSWAPKRMPAKLVDSGSSSARIAAARITIASSPAHRPSSMKKPSALKTRATICSGAGSAAPDAARLETAAAIPPPKSSISTPTSSAIEAPQTSTASGRRRTIRTPAIAASLTSISGMVGASLEDQAKWVAASASRTSR